MINEGGRGREGGREGSGYIGGGKREKSWVDSNSGNSTVGERKGGREGGRKLEGST